MVKKDRFVLNPDTKVFTKDGKKYRMVTDITGRDGHTKRVIFEEFNEKKHESRVNALVKYIQLKSNLTVEDVLIDVCKDISLSDLKKLEQKIRKGSRVTIKHGCLNVRVGGHEISIRD